MTFLERFFVATLKAVDTWFSVVWPASQVDVEERLKYGDMGAPYDDGIDQETTVDRP